MKGKKLLALLLCVVMGTGLFSACANKSGEPAARGDEGGNTQESGTKSNNASNFLPFILFLLFSLDRKSVV